MAIPFSRTIRSLEADNFRIGAVSSLVALLIISGWIVWLFYARVPIYAVSDRARLEAANELYYVASPTSGYVVAVHMNLGKELKEGDVLFELDAKESELSLVQEQTRQTAGASQIDALRAELRNEEEALENERRAGKIELEEGRSRYQELAEASRFAEEEAKRMLPLYKAGILPEIEYQRLQSEAKKKYAAAEAVRLSLERFVWDQKSKENNRKARLEDLKTQMVTLEGNIATSKAAGERLTHDVNRRLVRSPVFGQVGEMSNLRVGSVVHEGDKLGAIIPHGELRAIGLFAPGVAVGRIRIGQAAQLRLDGFPWTQYGIIPMTVESIGNEARDGHVRIEFKVQSNTATNIPIQHGLTGSVEVEVDQLSPATLLLRIIGKRLESPASTQPVSAAPLGVHARI